MSVNIRSFQEVERRLANLTSKNEDVSKKVGTTLKVSNKMNSFYNSLIINLKDLLKNQSEISLWFFDEDIPTLTNNPASDWQTSDYSKHYGDIFYSKTKGRIYEFNNSAWCELNDESLRKAMALTDSQLIDGDNERKVFVSTPSPPYESGDWYIHEDGSLYICQVGRTEGKYVETDFISSVDYAGAVAEKTGNQTIITKGTVITETAEAVTYLDKSTNTTSTISGDSIRTGSITSNNYVKNNAGTRINLNDGSIDAKNFKLSADGSIVATNGTFNGVVNATSGNFGDIIIQNKGLLTNLHFDSIPSKYWGFLSETEDVANPINLTVTIPANFIIDSATISIWHMALHSYIMNVETTKYENYYGYVRSPCIYSVSTANVYYNWVDSSDIYGIAGTPTLVKNIGSAFSNKGASQKVYQMTSSDITKFLGGTASQSLARTYVFYVYPEIASQQYTQTKDKHEHSGYGKAYIDIIGYFKK